MNIPENVGVALVAGLFGLVPVLLQWFYTNAQRRDRNSRLNNLRAELEFLDLLAATEVIEAVDYKATSEIRRKHETPVLSLYSSTIFFGCLHREEKRRE